MHKHLTAMLAAGALIAGGGLAFSHESFSAQYRRPQAGNRPRNSHDDRLDHSAFLPDHRGDRPERQADRIPDQSWQSAQARARAAGRAIPSRKARR